MAASVATPLEKQFSTIAGIDNMTSSSQLGSTSITIQFSLDRNVDAAAQDVQAAISATLRTLPQGIIPPSYQKVNPADQPILFVTLSSTTVPLSVLDEIAQTQLAQQLSTVSGVAQVQVFGSQKRAVRIRMDPRRLYQLKLGTSDVAQAVASQSPNLPSGTLYGPNRAYVVQANGQLTEAAQFGALTVAYRNGAPVRLSDVAQVADSVQDDKTASWFGAPEAGEPIRRSITLAVQRQPGTNTVEVADEVKALLPKLTANLPGGVTIYPLYDRSQTIRESVHDVELTLLLTLVLVVLVVFLFLRSPRATAIPSVALPLSIAGTFAVMKVLGYSLDNLSLMALTLAVGFVVDDAIVVLENIVRHREMGKDAMTAAHEGSEEVAFTVLSMTLSLAAVFLPLLFMGGIVGRLFREFSVTIAVSILVSGVVSLTVTPMLASRFLTSGSERDARRGAAPLPPVLDLFERGYAATHRLYERTLRWTMGHRPVVLAGSALVLVGTYGLYKAVPTGLHPERRHGLPARDHRGGAGGELRGDVAPPAGGRGARPAGPERGRVRERDRRRARTDQPGAVHHPPQGPRRAPARRRRRGARAHPQAERGARAADLRAEPAHPPDRRAAVEGALPVHHAGHRPRRAVPRGERAPGAPARLAHAHRPDERPAARHPHGLADHRPRPRRRARRERAGHRADALRRLRLAPGVDDLHEHQPVLGDPRGRPRRPARPRALGLLYVKGNTGSLVPLSAVTTVRNTVGPLAVNHSGQVPSVTISFNLRDGVALGTATRAIEAEAAEVFPAASGIVTSFGGTAQAFQASQAGLAALLLLAVLVIYGILGVLYESFIHPITILSGLPFAVFGALLALFIFGQELSVYAFIGLVLLIGLVKKNAIMMVDFAVEAERTRGSSRGSRSSRRAWCASVRSR
jgi:HAE1 family hydrophobic/amphiphilic exporter-1